MKPRRIGAFVIVLSAMAFAVWGSVPFHGLAGSKLAVAVGGACGPKTPVEDPYGFWRGCVKEIRLPLDGGFADISRGWPDDVAMAEVVPAAWWTDADDALRQCMARDLVNLWPAKAETISRKGIYPPAEIDRTSWSNGSFAAGFLTVEGMETNGWEPADGVKGDVARTVMYMRCVYPWRCFDPWSGLIFSSDRWFTEAGERMLLKWSREDPVDDYERMRNSLIAGGQGAGNPFVDYPGLEEYIWGDKRGVPYIDEEVDPDEMMPLRSVYSIGEPKIFLNHPAVAAEARWSVDGMAAADYVSPSAIGCGRHEVAFSEPGGRSGKVIISVVP